MTYVIMHVKMSKMTCIQILRELALSAKFFSIMMIDEATDLNLQYRAMTCTLYIPFMWMRLGHGYVN